LQTLLAWVLWIVIIAAAYPWAAWLTRRGGREDGQLLTWLVALGIGVGTLTQVMLWQGLVRFPYDLWGITLPYLVLTLPGWVLWWQNKYVDVGVGTRLPKACASAKLQIHWTQWFAVAIIVLIGAAILFNAAYWPFSRDDARLYELFTRRMVDSRNLLPLVDERRQGLQEAYPMLVPLSYVYTYIASGWRDEYLARVVSTVLSLGCVPAAFVLAKLMYGRLTGWIAALLLILTPTFADWASAGYADLPMAFFYTLSAIFAYRLSQSRHWSDALLTGMMMGLAAWTKNAALLGVAVLGLWLLWVWFSKKLGWREILIVGAVVTIIAAPWYIRNLIGIGTIIPPTAWTDQANRSLQTLLVFITRPEAFALSGWIILIGLIAAIRNTVGTRRALSLLPQTSILPLWTLSFFAAWWLFVSYDPRFLLLFLPILTVIGANWLMETWKRLSDIWQKRALLPATILTLILAGYIAWNSIEYKTALLRDPLMDSKSKHEVVGSR
jgi:4-amino-4-deoxy-L-arabinose transferase-like glycosyltransferase